jgi:hypothetical protein
MCVCVASTINHATLVDNNVKVAARAVEKQFLLWGKIFREAN